MSKQDKLTPKQEKFCQVFIETGNASESYRQAYDAESMKESTINRTAVELLGNRKITARLDGLRGIHAEKHNITIDRLTNMFMATYHLAFALNNPSAMTAAAQGLGKLHGIMTERGIIEHTGVVTHEHAGLSRTLELLGEFRGAGQEKSIPRPLPH